MDADIQNAVTPTIQARGWPSGLGAVYFVFTAQGIDSCDSPGSCADNIFCAYHGDFMYNGQLVIYANMPFATSWPGCGAGAPYPNDFAADQEVDTISHEHFEAVTDPLFLNAAWYDPTGDEIADKCLVYGSRAADGHNVMMNRHPYLVQLEWSNRESNGVTPNLGCSKGYVYFLPLTLFGH